MMQFTMAKNNDVRRHFGQSSQCFGPSYIIVDSWQIAIAHLDHKMTTGGESTKITSHTMMLLCYFQNMYGQYPLRISDSVLTSIGFFYNAKCHIWIKCQQVGDKVDCLNKNGILSHFNQHELYIWYNHLIYFLIIISFDIFKNFRILKLKRKM